MRWWGRVESPVRAVEREWIETSLDWMVGEFGRARLLGAVVLPTDEFFPGVYRGSRDDIRAVFRRLCAHMGVDPGRIDLEHDADDEDDGLAAYVPLNRQWQVAAGHHRIRGGRSVIGIRDDKAAEPMALVATIAHELGHAILLNDGLRIDPEREDHEPLTDLLTVFYGLGIFAANAAFEFNRHETGYRTSRLGYLTEPMFGYALARYAWLRGEPAPTWASYLDTNPRAYLKRGLRYLAQNPA
ncbi:hypothetical protein AB0J83_17810 [Actinoplanes sp. NPDC049596]|uniref:hypothetical protein n=1 Tax=unclassified Actinoplanes TaxID=2626549 RepID=UPI003428FEE5